MFSDPANRQMIDAFTFSGCDIRLITGELAHFHSWNFHEAFPSRAKRTRYRGFQMRVSVACRCSVPARALSAPKAVGHAYLPSKAAFS